MNKAQQIIIFLLRAKLNLTAVISVKKAARMAFSIFCTPFRKPRNVPPPIFLKSHEFDIDVEGYRIHGYRWNESGSKKVLIVHGFESRAYNFDRYVVPLIRLGYTVYAMDAKAHGKSEGKTITAPETAKMIQVLEEKVGQFDGFMCHSFGGISVALHQEKFNNPNARLVFIAPATETETALHKFCDFFRLNEKVRAEMDNIIFRAAGVRSSFYSIKRIMPYLKNPVLWIHDKDDDITPLSDVSPLIDLAPDNIEFMITEGLGHRKIYKDNRVQKKVIDFLS
ncbi:MAG: alpha/beta hydrolase [Chitinophagia bacterium]|nr:alpha/beta hydrolase [Chitinophagia bacterium]